jgi:FkbM family methyltransferase
MTLRTFAKNLLARAVGTQNYELLYRGGPPGDRDRPFGKLSGFLEDIRARGFAPSTIVDVGANHGRWSTEAHRVFPDARLILLEPVAALAPQLEKFVATVKGSRLIRAGAASAPGQRAMAEILTSDGESPGSTLSLPASQITNQPGKTTVREVQIQVVSLDSLLESGQLPAIPELVKIDVEGFELEVLKGAERLLGRTDMFILEVSLFPIWGQPIFHEIVAHMAGLGYVVYDFPGFNRRPLDGALGLVDVCFVRSGIGLRSSSVY